MAVWPLRPFICHTAASCLHRNKSGDKRGETTDTGTKAGPKREATNTRAKGLREKPRKRGAKEEGHLGEERERREGEEMEGRGEGARIQKALCRWTQRLFIGISAEGNFRDYLRAVE